MQYTPEVIYLRMKSRIRKLIEEVRRDIDFDADNFLEDERIVLAHPVRSNSFRMAYGLSFVPEGTWAGSGGVCV